MTQQANQLNIYQPYLKWLLFAAVYFLIAQLSLNLAFEQANTSPVWPPTGFAIAILVRYGVKTWPSILLGAFLANIKTELSTELAIGIAIGNCLEAVVAQKLILKFTSAYPFCNILHVVKFSSIIFLAALISATIGVTSLLIGNIIEWQHYLILGITWWLGDAVGGLIITPFLLTWLKPHQFSLKSILSFDVLMMLIATFFSITLVFSNWFLISGEQNSFAIIYLPIAVWVAYRFRQYGATLFLVAVSASAIYGTLHGYGPFVRLSTNESLLLLQGFMGIMTITTLTLVASVEESQNANEALAKSQKDLKEIVSRQSGDLRVAEEELKLAESVFNESVEAIIVTDKNAIILRVNPAFSRITGYSPVEAVGKNPKFLRSGHHSEAFFERYWETLCSEDCWQGEIWDKRKNGEVFPAWQTVRAVYDEQKSLIQYISIFSDISEKKVNEERIYHLAHFDTVTGLRNRIAFHEQLEKAIAFAERHTHQLAILYLDLDNFKLINDASGHSHGDLLLKLIASRIKKILREEDTIARLGGDEFVILIEDIHDGKEAILVAKKVLTEMAKPMRLENTEVVITGSIGISTFPLDGGDADTLLKNADVAMYRAKEKGRNTYQFFTPEMNAQAQERLILENDMRKGLERNEFLLHYQPQVDLASGKIIGFEVLARWQHPERGMIPPDIFIPIAEDSGLIAPLGEWVLRTACAQQKILQVLHQAPIRVSVNISGRQFASRHLVSDIERIIKETGIDPNNLELELTESIVMENVEENITTLNRLSERGILLAIDDFGTGYSSMAYLKRFPIDKLKIDRSFVRDIVSEPDDAAIVRATTLLGHSLHMKVIAEGVETLEQLLYLKKIGCDEIQGFYFSRPLSIEAFSELLKQKVTL